MYKLIALDIDGTLINQSLEITSPNRRAIKAAQRQGVLVTLATGRSFHSARNYADQLELDLPLICANGAIIRHRDGSILQESILPTEITAQLVKDMAAAGLFVQAYHRDGISTLGSRIGLFKWIQMICDYNKFRFGHLFYSLKEYRRSLLSHCLDLPEKVLDGTYNVHKIFCSGDKTQLEHFRDRAQHLNLMVEYYPGNNGRMYLEIMPQGVTKGTALAWLSSHLGLSMENVVAVGDNLNDTAMVTAAGLGVAMGNGHTDLKKIAGHITLTNDEDGVAAVIRDFILAPEKARPAV